MYLEASHLEATYLKATRLEASCLEATCLEATCLEAMYLEASNLSLRQLASRLPLFMSFVVTHSSLVLDLYAIMYIRNNGIIIAYIFKYKNYTVTSSTSRLCVFAFRTISS